MKNIIEELIKEELVKANKKFKPFHSRHEAYAVIKEEMEEVEENKQVSVKHFDKYWDCCRRNVENKVAIDSLKCLKVYVKLQIEELIQVAAMCDKAIVFEKKEEDDG